MAETIIKYNRLKESKKDISSVLLNSNVINSAINNSGNGSGVVADSHWKPSIGNNALIPKESQNIAEGENSIAIGTETLTYNEGELSLGTFNMSTSGDTMFSIGDGTDDTYRHNIFEVGKLYSTFNNLVRFYNNISGTSAEFNATVKAPNVSGTNATFTNITGSSAEIANISGNNATFTNTIKAPTISGTNATLSNSIKAPTISGVTGNLDNLRVNDTITTDKLEAVSGYIKTLLSEDITVDNLTVTKAAHFFKLIIDEIKATQGQIIITPSNAVIDKVETINGNYRCYFKATDGDKEISNTFEVNDQVVCQTFNAATGVSYNVSNTYYWRLCVATGTTSTTINGETVDCHYIDLSDTDKDTYSNSAPKEGDNVVQLGNRTDNTRQAAIIISAYNTQFLDKNVKAPSIVQYYGINDYILENHRRNVISRDFNEFRGTFKTSTGDDIEELIDDATSGVTTYLHTAWANSADGSVDFTKTPNGGEYSYVGLCSNYHQSDTNLIYSDYTWSYVKGANGADGQDGADGKDGKDGTNGTNGKDGKDGASGYTPYILDDYWYINGVNTGVKAAGKDGLNGTNGVDGASGTSTYFHVAYANKTTAGTITDFSVDTPTNRDWIGTYVDTTQADSTNPSKYTWQLVKGAQGERGISGTSGVDGRTSYLHIKYSNDGGSTFTSNNGETVGKYLGQYVDFNATDSSSVTAYTWALIKGEDGKDGKDGANGQNGADGKDGKDGANGTNGSNGKDAEFYKLVPTIEKAIVDKNGTLGVQLQYQIAHVSGSSITTVTANTSGYWIRFKRNDNSTYYNLSTSTTSPAYTNNSFITSYHTQSSKPIYLQVYLVYGSNATVVDQSIVNVVFDASATLEITNEIKTTVQGHTTSLNSLSNSISQVNQKADGISASVTTQMTTVNSKLNQAVFQKKVTVDATSLDESKAYPVSIKFNYNTRFPNPEQIHLQVSRPLNSSYGVPSSYGAHEQGFSCNLEWDTLASGWGANNVNKNWSTTDTTRFISNYTKFQLKNNNTEKVVGSIGQCTEQSTEIVYVRGGSKYDILSSWEDCTIALNSAGYSWVSGSYSDTRPIINASALVEPIQDQRTVNQVTQATLSITDSIQATVNSHTTQINTANGNIDTLQSDVSTLKQTASGLSSTVSSHTTTLNSHGTSISNNTTNINNLSGTVTSHTSSIGTLQTNVSNLQQTANGLTSTVNSHTTQISNANTNISNLQTKVDNIQIGSYNILRYTATPKYRNYNDDYNSASDGTWTKASDGSSTSNSRVVFNVSDAPVNGIVNGIRITKNDSNTVHARYNNTPLLANEYYTMSCYARLTSGSSKLSIQQGNGTSATNGYTGVDFALTSSWKQYSYTFKVNSTNTNFYVGANVNTGTVEVCGMMLEKGNVATCWKPNPNDYEANLNSQITTVTNSISNISQKADSISATVSSHTSSINSLSNTVTSHTQSIAALQLTDNSFRTSIREVKGVGQRSYFAFNRGIKPNSNTCMLLPYDYGFCTWSGTGRICNFGFTNEDYGSDWTLVFTIKASSTVSVTVDFCDKNPNKVYKNYDEQSATAITATTSYVTYRMTFTSVTSSYLTDTTYNGFLDFTPSTSSTVLYIKNIALVKGIYEGLQFEKGEEDLTYQGGSQPFTWNYNHLNTAGTYKGLTVYQNNVKPTTSGDYYDFIYFNGFTIRDKFPYTLSFWAKADRANVRVQSFFYGSWNLHVNKGDLVNNGEDGRWYTYLSTDWKHYTVHWMPHTATLTGTASQQYIKNILALRLANESGYANSAATISIAGVNFQEGWVEDGASSQGSLIEQTANNIRMEVGSCGINIAEQKITLNGDTDINGTLTLTDENQGFILAGDGGKTQITPQSIGSYDTFTASTTNNIFVNKSYGQYLQRVAEGVTSTTATWYTMNDFGIVPNGTYIPLTYQSSSFRKDGTSTFVSPVSVSNLYQIYIDNNLVSTITNTSTSVNSIGSYTTTSKGQLSIYRSTTATFRVSDLSNNNTSQYQTDSFYLIGSLNYKVQIPKESFTLIGYNGFASNFGTNSNVYFGGSGAYLRYGDYGLSITSTGIKKLSGSSWIPLNNLKVVRTSASSYSIPAGVDFVVTTSNSSQAIIFPFPSSHTGRVIYVKCNSSTGPTIYCNSTTNSTAYFLRPGAGTTKDVSFNLGGNTEMFISDGYSWIRGYMG